MTKVNFADGRKKAESEELLLGSGGYLKLQEGENRSGGCRSASNIRESNNGKPTFKRLCYVIGRRDRRIKPFFIPHAIYKHIEPFKTNPEYTFDEVPMPFDVTINAKGGVSHKATASILCTSSSTPE